MGKMYFAVDRCVMCGEIVDEGRQVCEACENKVNREHDAFLAKKAAMEAEAKQKPKRGLLGRFRRS